MVIIADMIISALSWEERPGVPQRDNRKITPKKPLTVIDSTDTLKASEDIAKEENNDCQN